MNGIHDLGGKDGFGRIEVAVDEPVFHARWEARVFGLNLTALANIDASRHAMERIDPASYLALPYYGRWLRGLETRLLEQGLLGEGEIEARMQGRDQPASPVPSRPEPGGGESRRDVDTRPAFAVGQKVRTRNHQPHGHTRLPAYARARSGVVAIVHPAFVLPDTHAHGLGECPEYVYAVLFEGRELWGDAAELGTSVVLDCFESYLEARD